MTKTRIRKGMAALVVLCMLLMMLPVSVFADTAAVVSEFSDMPDNWSTAALMNAVANGLVAGANGKIMPNENLTRAQMAAIVNRAFGTTEKVSLSSYTDVAAGAWYYNDMAKAVQMKTLVGTGNKLNPNASITREEAFVVLARAFKLSGAPESTLNKFSDKALVSQWAKDGVASLVSAGYVAGSNGQLNPKQYITRAEFAQMMDNLLKKYIKASGTYSTDFNGNVMINVPDVTLKNITVTGDLIIGDGVGNGDVTLDGVVVTGRTVIRGGGVNSIKIIGNSNLQNITIARVDGRVRVYSEDGTQIGDVIVDGSDDVIIEGDVGTVTVTAPDVTVTATNANIVSATIEGGNSTIVVGTNSTIQTVTANAANATITASEGSKIENIVVNSNGANINGTGDVGTVAANASNISVTTPGTSVAAATGTTGVTAGTETVAAGTTANTTGSTGTVTSGSTGGGGGSSTVAVSAITAATVFVAGTTTKTVTTSPSDAAVAAVSGTTGVATVSVANHTITITGVSAGTSTITVTSSKSGYTSGATTFTVTVNTPVDITAAAATITAPVYGEIPQTAAEIEAATANADYTVTSITWNEPLADAGGVRFKQDQVYTVTVVLTSKNSKKFQAGAFTPTVAGSASVGPTATTGTGVGNTVSFTVTYAATGERQSPITTLKVKAGSEAVVIAVVNTVGSEGVTVANTTTAGALKVAIESTDGSTQTYAVTNSLNAAKAGDVALVTGDKLVVTAADGRTVTYTVTVADTEAPTAIAVHTQAAKTIVYTFSEPVQLVLFENNNIISTVVAASAVTKDMLGIYGITGSTLTVDKVAPIASAAFDDTGKILTIVYTENLPTGSYVVTSLEYDTTDLSFNKIVDSADTVFTVADLTDYDAALAAVAEADYTTASWTTYQAVVDANVVTDQDTQADVDAATGLITAAQADLVTLVQAEAAKITVVALGDIAVTDVDAVLVKAQALVGVGYTVTVKAADGIKISAAGVALEAGAGTISFTVTEDATPAHTADTAVLNITVL